MTPRRGMTLVELVVALAISGAAIASGYQAFAMISDRRSIAAAHADSMARAFALRATLARWLSNARLTVEEDEVVFRVVEARRRQGDERTSADLVFLTSARSPVSDHGTIVHLFVDRDNGETGLTAELSEWRGQRVARLRLDPAIVGLSVQFTSVRGSRTDTTSSWVSSTILPATMRLRFAPRISDSLPPLLRLPLTIRLDATASLVPGLGS